MCNKRVFIINDTDQNGNKYIFFLNKFFLIFRTYGGFSNGIRVDSRFVCKIPENIPSEKAAPLLCAGNY